MTRPNTTIGNNRKEGELTASERRWCVLRARGYSQGAAYREAYSKPRVNVKDASARGCQIANKPRVMEYVKSLYREAKKSDMLSQADWLAMMIDAFNDAKAEGNLTAAASFGRLMGQGIAALSETLNLNDERMTDEQLIERLGASNPDLASAIKRMIGGRDTFH